jgi:hypothetical protein
VARRVVRAVGLAGETDTGGADGPPVSADQRWFWSITRRRRTGGWRDVSFVSSTKDILARCMSDKAPSLGRRFVGTLGPRFGRALYFVP